MMLKKLCLAAAMAAVAAGSWAGDLMLNGSTTVLPVAQKATEVFAKTNPEVTANARHLLQATLPGFTNHR